MGEQKIEFRELEQFVCDILYAAKMDTQEANSIAKVLVWCDMIGRSNHGLKRLPVIIKRFKLNLINSPCNAKFVYKSDAICLLEGNNGAGQFLGCMAMFKAIEIANQCGVGLVGVRNSNHSSVGAYYVQLAAEANKISMVTSNTFPLVVPHGGLTPVLGTNPFSFGAPVRGGQSILVDFATSVTSGSMMRNAVTDNRKVSLGLAIDEQGKDTDDPKKASKGGILPMAGAKGYCMGLMVEILSGLITGSAISHEVGSVWKDFTKHSRVGHFYLAIDIESIIPLDLYYNRMAQLIEYCKNAKKREDIEEILLPGEIRWRNYQESFRHGVRLGNDIVDGLQSLAEEFKIMAPWQKKKS